MTRRSLRWGLGREAIRLVLAHAVGPPGLHRVGLRVVAFNARRFRCYRARGLLEEGREREAALVGGAWYDDIMIGVLAQEAACNEGISSVLTVSKADQPVDAMAASGLPAEAGLRIALAMSRIEPRDNR